ncbi:MAG: polyphenol oxidase family protein [Planctomycetota bacterium]
MFERFQLDDGRAVWRSSLLAELGANHVFTTRSWGIRNAKDVRGLLEATGLLAGRGEPRVVLSKQVHGRTVSRPADRMIEADAHVADQPDTAAVVRTADCVPILLSTRGGHAVAAVHAGWRGLVPETGVVAEAVRALVEVAGLRMVEPGRGLGAAIGPCISAARYEVGPEVAERFTQRHAGAVTAGESDRFQLDLRRIAREQLVAAGLAGGSVDTCPSCTFDDAGDFFSYRREGRGVGHQAAVVVPCSGQGAIPLDRTADRP